MSPQVNEPPFQDYTARMLKTAYVITKEPSFQTYPTRMLVAVNATTHASPARMLTAACAITGIPKPCTILPYHLVGS
jgi:formyltetrahydrofolate synthetase